MASRMRPPETVKLDISQGDWLLVKQHLTAGEQRQIFARVMKTMHAGDAVPELDPMQADIATALVYLLDWSLTDLDGRHIVITNQPPAVVESALNALDFESFTEIVNAIQAHDVRMTEIRAVEKNAQATEKPSLATSPSPSTSDGDTRMLLNSR